MRTLRLALAAAAFAAAATARADELPPPNTPVERVIDQILDSALKAEGVTPAPQAPDAEFLRRVSLDLVGRIPTLPEVEAYLKADAGKRAKLVDRLMAAPGYARHQAALFEAMLSDKTGGKRGGAGALGEYLAVAFADNRPWDRVYRELMLPEVGPEQKGAADFLRPRLADADKLTNDVSVAFFGVNVSCAQCHDHPLVKDWTQDHFYGMKAFLGRTFDNGGALAERGFGQMKYKPNKGAEKVAPMMFLTGAKVAHESSREPTGSENKAEKERLDKAKAAKKTADPPAFSARAKLVEVSLKKENADFFARSVVNRMWHRFFGVGLVAPLDQMHSENPPSHPALLAWLARDTAAHGYDLKRLVRGIVMSTAYSRASAYPSESRPDAKFFAVANLKPLTPLQLATSLKIAAADPATFDGKKPEEVEKTIEAMERSARGFAARIAEPTDNFQIGVGEALLFSNGDQVMRDFLTDGPGTLLGRAKGEKDAAAIDLMVKTALGRPASAEERAALADYVSKRSDRRPEAYRQALWAVCTCPEFRFNH